MDEIDAAAAATRATTITLFAESQEADQAARGVSARRLGSSSRLVVSARRLGDGVAEQVALAQKASPATGARHVAFPATCPGSCPTPCSPPVRSANGSRG